VPRRESRLHKGVNGMRYGMGLHEFRNLAKSLCHTKAEADGFDMDAARSRRSCDTCQHTGSRRNRRSRQFSSAILHRWVQVAA